jgi:lysyl-tRNA synthetase class 2
MSLTPRELQTLRNVLKDSIREFFASRGFIEVETPIAVLSPGTEVHLNYFETKWNDYRNQSHPLFLRSSPELHMKQLLAQGSGNIFQFATCFRNGGEYSHWHHPEFTMLEWYDTGATYTEFMDQTVDLLRYTAAAFAERGFAVPQLPDQFAVWSVFDAFAKFAGIELQDGDPNFAAKARAEGIISVRPDDDFETAYFKVLLDRVEPELSKLGAVILHEFPPSQAALSVVEGGRAKRFEIYVGRVELCNAFLELTDEGENLRRYTETGRLRGLAGKPIPAIDPGFAAALKQGIPRACGNALGFDRWFAMLIGADRIDSVIPFRTMLQPSAS